MADDAVLRRQDVTCIDCGARSREGFAVPDGRNCEQETDFGPRLYPHDWVPTDELGEADIGTEVGV